MSEIKEESPLVGRSEAVSGGSHRAEGGVSLCERPFLGHLSLRGKSSDDAFTQACEQTLGVALPVAANTSVEGDGIVVCWMGPTEWLIVTDGAACAEWAGRLRTALDGVHAGVVELSGGQTVIEVRGRHAVDVLAKGTSLDLHPRSFGSGQCTRTLIAHTTAFIRVVEPGQAFEVVVRRSFADHLWRWLCDAAEEYGCSIETPESALASATPPVAAEKHNVESLAAHQSAAEAGGNN